MPRARRFIVEFNFFPYVKFIKEDVFSGVGSMGGISVLLVVKHTNRGRFKRFDGPLLFVPI